MLWVSALVTTLVMAVGALSVYTMHLYVDAYSDSEVAHSLAAFEHSYLDRDGRPVTALTDFTGQAPGTLIAVMSGDDVLSSAMFDDDGPQSAPPDLIADLESVDWTGSHPATLDLGDEGGFRVASTQTGDGLRLVSAVSMESANEAIAIKVVAVLGITAIAAVLAAVGTVVLVRQALRPMRRVAATAARAARIPLADEHHRITTRVRRADSDPDSEVGIVGETLNRLLANVDSALAVRAESDRRMRRFLTDASHELRTPLAAIRGYAELTRQDGPSLPATTEYALARIESESRRMTALVGDMLLLTRMDEGQGLEIETVDLCALVVDAINDVAVTAPDHDFQADLPDGPVWVEGDRARLHQVVSNLLTNARNHTPAGVSVTTTVRPPSEDPDGWVAVSVVDDGPGVEPELLPDLFGRFVRANKARSREMNSSGLGLAIVASIVEAHGGTVGAQSRPGRTEFLVRLPDVPSGRLDLHQPAARAAQVTPAP
ncbi:sensor histidine kinase [Mycolicibacterium sediminis]|uniref:histidine kinase n=1 Tax=Mycolicibacterium sediminis TaxID=1286180 RepID=A0A7I7QU78_9MYCO|nr:HAMP domain-containing sensor histidine kinase [Mycolicibacterium sediminis]BBY29893.1 two-component sensor histidine kinase [Mycolicibacterium sediminis]